MVNKSNFAKTSQQVDKRTSEHQSNGDSFFSDSQCSITKNDSKILVRSRKGNGSASPGKTEPMSKSGLNKSDAMNKSKFPKRASPARRIQPNKTIKYGIRNVSKSPKYKIDMYDPATNTQTLQNFFSVKLVKKK